MINVTINGTKIEVQPNTTILEVARKLNIDIPTLCHLDLDNIKYVNDGARCRVCVVEVLGKNNLVTACNTIITDGMEIKTHTPRSISARRANVELLLSNHPKDCLTCPKNGQCELQELSSKLGISKIDYEGKMQDHELDISNNAIVRNKNKCILCGRCETMCNVIQTVGVYSNINRGFNTAMTTAFDDPLAKSPCTYCGQCVSVCPTAALTEVTNRKEVWAALNHQDKFVIVQTAPAVRVALGEMFGFDAGTNVTGKMISSLRKLGFDKVYDTNFAADLTVVEETYELLTRLNAGGPLPMLTSCCPAWVNFIEYHYPNLLSIPSTCKSPHEMFGAIAKTYLAEKLGIAKEKIVVVSIMPCLAKKYEANREELKNEYPNVDYVITTRELSRMIMESGIDFNSLEDEEFDNIMGKSSGAAAIFGTTGGVLEAVLRSANFALTNSTELKIEFKEIRDMKSIREAEVTVGGQNLKVAITHGLGNARILLDKIQNKEAKYDVIEIMACPGGCIGGGGQPYYHKTDENLLNKRRSALFKIDTNSEVRISLKNPEIKELYQTFLGKIGGEKAHELLHTTYKNKK